MQSQSFRQSIEKEWGMKAIDANYGLSDAISIMGSEREAYHGLSFSAGDFLYCEILDKNKKALDFVEGTIGELTVTSLGKEAQPLLRYRTGDVIELGHVQKPHHHFSFKLAGRSDDMIIVKGINFHPESIRNVLQDSGDNLGPISSVGTSGRPDFKCYRAH